MLSLRSLIGEQIKALNNSPLRGDSQSVQNMEEFSTEIFLKKLVIYSPRKPRGGQSGQEKWRDESFQARVKELLGTDSHRTFFKRSSECWLLIGHKKCFVLL